MAEPPCALLSCKWPGGAPATKEADLLAAAPKVPEFGKDPADDALAVDSELLLPGSVRVMPPRGAAGRATPA